MHLVNPELFQHLVKWQKISYLQIGVVLTVKT